MFLVDTNILSEMTKAVPNAAVLAWLNANEPLIQISSVTIGEIHYGIELLATGKKQTELRRWLNILRNRFAGCILPFDDSVALRWGSLKASLDRRGHKLPVVDSLLSATALEHDLTLVTANTKDFLHSGVKLLDPT
jgi:predicted nucleic acid-binding protein